MHGLPCGSMGETASAVVVNERGRPHTDPCDDYCGPLDALAWYAAADRELRAAESQRGRMAEGQRQRLDYLRSAYDSLPARATVAAPVPLADREAVTRAAATLAGQARRLLVELDAGRSAPPPGAAPAPGGGGLPSLPSLPGLPSLPQWPGLPALDGLGLLLLVLLVGFGGGLFVGGKRR